MNANKSCVGPLRAKPGTPEALLIQLVFTAQSYRDFHSWHCNSVLGSLLWGWDPGSLGRTSEAKIFLTIFNDHTWV